MLVMLVRRSYSLRERTNGITRKEDEEKEEQRANAEYIEGGKESREVEADRLTENGPVTL